MTDHLVFQPGRLSYPCASNCGSWEATHCIGLRFYCAGCCPVCKVPTPPVERTGPVVGLVGSQGGLW